MDQCQARLQMVVITKFLNGSAEYSLEKKKDEDMQKVTVNLKIWSSRLAWSYSASSKDSFSEVVLGSHH